MVKIKIAILSIKKKADCNKSEGYNYLYSRDELRP